jgi:hypothetical protein
MWSIDYFKVGFVRLQLSEQSPNLFPFLGIFQVRPKPVEVAKEVVRLTRPGRRIIMGN